MFLGETIGFWIQTSILCLSVIVAVVVIWHNGRIARRRATVDMIINEQRDTEYNKHFRRIMQLLTNGKRLIDLAEPQESDSEDLISVRFILNRLEFIAQGIRQGAFEEQIYKDLTYSDVMWLWKEVRPLVEEIRRKRNVQTYYQELEWLATRWKENPIKKL